MQAIIALAQLNSRMKDFYDIYTLLNSSTIDFQMQREAIIQTFANRNTPLNFETTVFTADFYEHESLQKMWKAFLNKINAEAVTFGTVVNRIAHFVKETFNED